MIVQKMARKLLANYIGKEDTMKKIFLILTVSLNVLLGVTLASAANHYVRAGASGNGSDWTNASGSLPASLTRGDVYYVAEGSYGGYTFSGSGSGTITIKKATPADHGTDTGWQDSYGDGVAAFSPITFSGSNYVFDGQTGGGPGSWTSGFGFRISNSGAGSGNDALVWIESGASNITIAHTEMAATRNTKTAGIKGTGGGNSNIRLTHSYIHALFGVHFHMNGWSDSTIEYSHLSDNHSTAEWHSEGISYLGTVTNLVIRYNIWHKIEGTAVFAGVNSGQGQNWKIYGNVLSSTDCPPLAIYTDGSNNNSMSGLDFHNNVIADVHASQGGIYIMQGSNNRVYNNIWFHNDVNTLAINATHDYNWFYDNIRTDGCSPACDMNPGAVSAEAHAQAGTGNPFVNWDGVSDPAGANFHLKAATNPGLTLAAPFNIDMSGNVRGADGTWDRGAYEFGGTPPTPDTQAPTAPKGLRLRQ
jgi:hypothetical protein